METQQVAPIYETPIIVDAEVEKKKGETWYNFGVAAYREELSLQAWAQQIIAAMKVPQTIHELPKYETDVATAKEQLKGLVTRRKITTSKFDAVAERLMKPEKEVAAHIESLAPKVIELKKQLQEQNKKGEEKNKEVLATTQAIIKYVAETHALIEQSHVKLIADAYEYALSNIAPEKIEEFIEKVSKRVTEKNVTIAKPTFSTKYLTPEELEQLMQKTFQPKTPESYLEKFKTDLKLRFSDYENAYKNREQALQISQSETQQAVESIANEQMQSSAAAEFQANANAVSYGSVVSGQVKELKETYVLQLDETQQNAVLVMSAFVANLAKCLPHVRVSKWFNLSVKQMVAALEKVKTEDNAFQFSGLQFSKGEKL